MRGGVRDNPSQVNCQQRCMCPQLGVFLSVDSVTAYEPPAVGQVRAAGGDVASTGGVSPMLATVVGLEPETASRLFSPIVSNPVPVVEGLQRP